MCFNLRCGFSGMDDNEMYCTRGFICRGFIEGLIAGFDKARDKTIRRGKVCWFSRFADHFISREFPKERKIYGSQDSIVD